MLINLLHGLKLSFVETTAASGSEPLGEEQYKHVLRREIDRLDGVEELPLFVALIWPVMLDAFVVQLGTILVLRITLIDRALLEDTVLINLNEVESLN